MNLEHFVEWILTNYHKFTEDEIEQLISDYVRSECETLKDVKENFPSMVYKVEKKPIFSRNYLKKKRW